MSKFFALFESIVSDPVATFLTIVLMVIGTGCLSFFVFVAVRSIKACTV